MACGKSESPDQTSQELTLNHDTCLCIPIYKYIFILVHFYILISSGVRIFSGLANFSGFDDSLEK